MSKSVGSNDLSMKMGMDLSEFEQGFIDAKKSFRQNMAQLRGMKKDLKLKMDIDIAKLGPAATETQKLAVREQYLTQQITAQKASVALLNDQYSKMASLKGENDRASKKLQTSMLYEQRSLANMQNELQRTKQAGSLGGLRGALDTGSALGLNTGAAASIASAAAFIGPQAALVAGLAAVTKGAFDMTESATKAGDSLYMMSNRMGISAQDAAQLSRMLQFEDVDTQAFTGAMMRLDKQLLNAGENGNAITLMLSRFGVNLTDAKGNLLPMNKQLEKLAEGYRIAAAAGEQDAYVTQILGTRGMALIPILQKYSDAQDMANKVASSDIPIDKAHELTEQHKLLNMQVGSLEKAFGAAFIPLANEILPAATEALKKFADLLNDTKKAVDSKDSNSGFTIGKRIHDSITEVKTAMHNGFFKTLLYNYSFGKNKGNPLFDLEESKAQAEKLAKQEKEVLQQVEAKKKAAQLGDKPKTSEQEKKEQEQQKKIQALQLETFKLTHDQLTSQLHDLDLKAEAYRKEGQSEKDITAYVEAEKAKIREEFQANTLDRLNSIYKTDLQNRLDSIEKEKQAYIKKGVDEVEADKWAADQKKAITQEAALDVIKKNKKRLLELQDAMKADQGSGTVSGIDPKTGKMRTIDINGRSGGTVSAIDPATGEMRTINIPGTTAQSRVEALQEKYRLEDLKAAGVSPDDRYSMSAISKLLDINKYNKDHLLDGILTNGNVSTPNNVFGAQFLSGMAAPKVINNQPNITVNIDQPIVRDNGDISSLADMVADKIQPAIEQALGGQGNGY